MTSYFADIEANGEIVLESKQVHIVETVGHGGRGLKRWHGHLNSNFDEGHFELGEYYLHLDDGREGKILISNIHISGQGQKIQFLGNGPLKEKES